jgi:thioesterase domain-containing protein
VQVTSAEVAAWEPVINSLAQATPWAGEHDDLMQEGRIAVWQSLQRGIRPSQEFIRNRMRDWGRFLKRGNLPYDAILPMDDYRDIPAR